MRPMRPPHRRGTSYPAFKRREGFTLPEMLAVIAIVVIIISLLLPSLSRSKETAKIVICRSNMRQFAVANHNYATEWRAWFLPIRNADGSYWMSNTTYRGFLGLPTGSTFPEDIICQSLHPDSVGSGGPLRNFYGWNRGLMSWDPPILIRRNRVKSPSQVIQIVDGTDWHIHQSYADYTVNWDVHRHTRLWSVAYRHDEGANVVHFDGHAAFLFKWEAWPVTAAGRDALWNIVQN